MTPRQQQLLGLLQEPQRATQIAQRLGVSVAVAHADLRALRDAGLVDHYRCLWVARTPRTGPPQRHATTQADRLSDLDRAILRACLVPRTTSDLLRELAVASLALAKHLHAALARLHKSLLLTKHRATPTLQPDPTWEVNPVTILGVVGSVASAILGALDDSPRTTAHVATTARTPRRVTRHVLQRLAQIGAVVMGYERTHGPVGYTWRRAAQGAP